MSAWVYRPRTPSLGTYVQMQAVCDACGSTETVEGFVVEVEGLSVYLSQNSELCVPFWTRWRVPQAREHDARSREMSDA